MLLILIYVLENLLSHLPQRVLRVALTIIPMLGGPGADVQLDGRLALQCQDKGYFSTAPALFNT